MEPSRSRWAGYPSHDFAVATNAGENVWSWQCGKIILDAMVGETVEPGEEMELVGDWEQADNQSEPVPAGTYLIRGSLMMDPPERLVTPPHQLQVLK